jgi:hypothetical protein
MASADIFSGAKNAFTFHYAYLNTVAQEIGMERAIALDARVSEMMGAAQGQAIKAQAGLDEIDLEKAAALANASIEEGFGISSELRQTEESADRIVFRCGRCPVYEAAEAAGMDHETIEAMCRASAIHYMDTMVKQWNPNLSYRQREFRSSADGRCVEELVLS